MTRVAKQIVDLRSIARSHTESAVRVLASVMQQPKAPHAARVTAASVLLDRGWGKAPQQLVSEDGLDIRITIRQIIERAGEVIDVEPETIDDSSQQIEKRANLLFYRVYVLRPFDDLSRDAHTRRQLAQRLARDRAPGRGISRGGRSGLSRVR